MSRQGIVSVALLAVALTAGGSAIAAIGGSTPINGNVGVNGTVANRCLFTSSNVIIDIGEMANVSGQGSGIGHLDPAKLNSQTATLTGWCNGTAATMSVQAFAMMNKTFTTTPPPGFTNRVDFTATAQVSPAGGPVSVSDDSISPAGATPQSIASFNGNINVAFSNAAAVNDALLIAGAYEGSVVVTLAPTT